MPGPVRVIELQSQPSAGFRADALYLFEGKLWRWQPAGCILCVESEDPGRQTLQQDSDPSIRICRTHGRLRPVTCRYRRRIRIELGRRSAVASRLDRWIFWFPQKIKGKEREELVERLVGEAIQLEPLPLFADPVVQ